MSSKALHTSKSDFAEWINQLMEEQRSFAQVPQEKIEEIYALAYVLYQKQQYQESSHLFRLLVIACPFKAKFWKGLGACLQMQKDYEEALDCYCCCAQFSHRDQPDPYLYVQTADCYFALKQIDTGLKALEAARLNAKKTQDMRVLQHVALMQQMWSRK